METQRILDARNGQLMLQPEWRSRNSDQHLFLFVGEGNCSYSSCLATAFGAATNMVATTLDSRGVFLQKYGMEGEKNTSNLSQRGALVFHGFDACKMATQHKNFLRSGFQSSRFHRIIFNFPHAGFLGPEDDAQVMEKHKELVRLFFANARDMLLPGGQVHVSHKLGHPYDEWKLEEQAQVSGLRLVERVPFHRDHFPGYRNCRGDGSRAGEPFPLGPADTYIFEARIEEPTVSFLNVREPLGMSSSVLAHLQSPKEKALCKAGAFEETSLQQVVADEVTRLENLKRSRRKMKTLQNLKLALQQMNLENYPIPPSCATDEPPATALNVGEPLGMSNTVLAELQSPKEKALCKAGASEETSLQQVVADEVTRLENLKRSRRKMKTLQNLKLALQQMNLENYPIPPSCATDEPHATALNVGEPLGMSNTVLAELQSPKEKALCKAGASEETSLQQVVADEVTRLENLKCSRRKMKNLQNLKLALQQMNLENYPIPPSCATDEPPATALNVGEPLGMSNTVLAELQSPKEKALCKAGASEETSLQQVVADEVTRLEKLQLGKKKMKTLEALAEDLGGSFNEEHAKIIEMFMASLSNSVDVNRNSQNIGCIECILPALSPETTLVPLLSPETKLEGADLVSQVNPNEVLVLEKEDITKFHLTLDTRLGLSDESAGTISTLDKREEEIKEEFTSSKQLLVAPLQRNIPYETVDLHVNSALNVGDPVGMSLSTIRVHLKSLKQAIRKARSASQVTPLQQVVADEVARLEKLKNEEQLGKKKMKTLETLKSALPETNLKNILENFQLVEASVEALAQDLWIFLEEENKEIIDMDKAVSASAAHIESHDILEPSPQFSKVSAEPISTINKVEEDIKVECPNLKQEAQLPEIQLMDDVAPLQREKEETSGLNEETADDKVVEEERKEDSKQKPKKRLRKKLIKGLGV